MFLKRRLDTSFCFNPNWRFSFHFLSSSDPKSQIVWQLGRQQIYMVYYTRLNYHGNALHCQDSDFLKTFHLHFRSLKMIQMPANRLDLFWIKKKSKIFPPTAVEISLKSFFSIKQTWQVLALKNY